MVPVRGWHCPRLLDPMAIITALPPVDIRSRAGQYTERSTGLHLSDITGDILLTLDAETYGRDDADDSMWMNFLVGLIFERAIELAWLDKEITGAYRPGLIRPGEVSKDGVTGTPDALDYLAGERGRPLEFKCTKKSCRQHVTDPKFWIYWVQLKAYAHMLGLNEGELHILHINGNYSRDPKDPESGYVVKSWLGQWSTLELEENWSMLTTHARRRGWIK